MEGAEVRRLLIIYFLSREGRIEHPHLIRVHHLSRNGVRLRDVKRWLGEMRGKEMPESFSWSYKRTYKTGYVWQDLLDDDLITPISDNEYVLKGSEISSTTHGFSYTDEKAPSPKNQSSVPEDQKNLRKEENQSHSSETSMYVSTKSSSEIEEESPTFGSETSTLTDDSGTKVEMDKSSGATTKHEEQERSPSFNDDKAEPLSCTALTKNSKKRSNRVTINETISTTPSPADPSKTSLSSSEPHFAKSKSHSSGASNMFRNLITCGAVDTEESAVVPINKQNNRPFWNICSGDLLNVHPPETCKRDRLGCSQRIFGTPSWTQQHCNGRKSLEGGKDSAHNEGDLRDQRAPGAAFKPVNAPKCSQCGKAFKPEKLYSHMKSCKGMKALSKAAAEKVSKGSKEFRNRDSVSGHLLTYN